MTGVSLRQWMHEGSPYRWPGIFSVLVVVGALFGIFFSGVEVQDSGDKAMDVIDVVLPISLDDAAALTPDGADIVEGKEDDPDSLSGILDASFAAGIVMPRPVGGLIRIFPPMARESGVEALVRLLVVVNAVGKVEQVAVIGVLLKQNVSSELAAQLKRDFAVSAVKTIENARYSVPMQQGKPVKVRIEETIDFTLR